MLDFLMISVRNTRNGPEIYPKFLVKKSSDLMIRGSDFYAIWNEKDGVWSTDEQEALMLIDRELDEYASEYKSKYGYDVTIKHMWDSESGMIDNWHKYCQRQLRDSYSMLDETIIFANTLVKKTDYASKKLGYSLEKGSIENYDRLMSVLYSEEERHKIEWAIGSIVCGDSKILQKFMVLYGPPGSGKSTILNIIQQLFSGYYSVFDAKALGSSTNSFALEPFKMNPLVAIQHDGDLSRIEDNTRLNSLVSHELMTVNEKFKSAYTNRFKCFLFMGTNKPVKISDAKSGLLRRLIDVTPTGNKLNPVEYRDLMRKISFELGAIAYHCQEIYLNDPGYYDDYVPTGMMGASNDFYNFIIDNYSTFQTDDGVTIGAAWDMYKQYVDDAKIEYPLTRRIFKEELKNYFELFDGKEYSGFKTKIFESNVKKETKHRKAYQILFKNQPSILDDYLADCPAQMASESGIPSRKWEKVTTKLIDLDTSEIHYVKVPENHIVIDFDIPGPDGSKSFDRNLEAASKWPPTYAELSKSGAGIHLHYNYIGDVSKLSSVYDDHIEVKVFSGNSSLRRKLSLCNDLPIANLSEGLPLKGDKMINYEVVTNEKGLRTTIKRNLNKEIHPGTKPSVDFIYKVLEDAYNSGVQYDVSDLKNQVYAFAANSTHQAEYCLKLVASMHFKSEEADNQKDFKTNDPIVFYDVEVFPNLFVVCWKYDGQSEIIRMINPSSKEIESLFKYKLVGFNNLKYDNHILYARYIGYTNEELYKLSKKLVCNDPQIEARARFQEAYNISYTDIYDFSSAANKKSLKKWEIELGIRHMELGLDWNQPVPEELWNKVAEYCCNDVDSTEKVFYHLKADWIARQILADIAGGTVNETTNQLSTKIIFGNDKNPQTQFNYRNLGDTENGMNPFVMDKDGSMYHVDDKYSVFNNSGMPVFPGYKFEFGKSSYRGEDIGEGGYVYAEPGIYFDVALLDVASMHPHSVLAEQLFGELYTSKFQEIVDARIAVKHEDWDTARRMLDGKLSKHIDRVIAGEITSEDLATALKTVINSIYGLTSAKFPNKFKDPRNIDNIVAKRGELFMINLKHAVMDRGYTVVHIKTDSIKIANATPEIIQFCMDYALMYGYTFEHEATYDRICLVNDSVYIAKYASPKHCEDLYGYVPGKNSKHACEWTATGKEFALPYTFKTLFTNEDTVFEDYCVTNEVHGESAIYMDMNEDLPDVSKYERELEKLLSIPKDKKKGRPLTPEEEIKVKDLQDIIDTGHNYVFVGRIGNFCPIKPGKGGGILVRKTAGKYYALSGSKGYRWLESAMVKELDKIEDIDLSYHDKVANDSRDKIGIYGNYDIFISDDPMKDMPPWESSSTPFTSAAHPWDESCPFDVR